MSKEEIALQLTLKLLENFAYKAEDFGGDALFDQAESNAVLATKIFNGVYSGLNTLSIDEDEVVSVL